MLIDMVWRNQGSFILDGFPKVLLQCSGRVMEQRSPEAQVSAPPGIFQMEQWDSDGGHGTPASAVGSVLGL